MSLKRLLVRRKLGLMELQGRDGKGLFRDFPVSKQAVAATAATAAIA